MKKSISKPPPVAIPRLKSLLHRLQRAPGTDDLPRLDQLMIFLDDPPAGICDRWKEGAKMCNDWGIPCTGPSVWRLYRSYSLEWRLRLAQEASAMEPGDSIDEKMAQMASLRTFEILANPHSPAVSIISVARIELRKTALEFARQKHQDRQRQKTNLALDALAGELAKNPAAEDAFIQFRNLIAPMEEQEEILTPPD